MFVYIVLCFALLAAPSRAVKVWKPTTTTERSKEQLPVKDLLQGVGSKQLIGESFYNETSEVKLCFANILYVNESKGFANPWHEYRVVFEFPEVEEKHHNTSKKYVQYGIEISEDDVRQCDFEVIEEHPDYMVSKHENITCGVGRFLAKAYYESPEHDRKKIVFRLSNEVSGFKYGKPDFQDIANQRENDVLGASNAMESSGSTISTGYDDQTTHTDNANLKTTPMPIPISSFRKQLNENSLIPSDNNFDKNFDSASIGETAETTTESIAQPLTKVDPCSPFLAQFFSGSTFLPGLCNLTKDQTVVMQGDIVVSKKYLNAQNQSEVLQPLFIIHENTEIESTLKKIETDETS